MRIDNLFGIHERALVLRARRTELIANNLANADTPGFKARDIDFAAALGSAQQLALERTRPGHLGGAGAAGDAELLYRVPSQPSLDGNTVDPELERSAFAENALRYLTTLQIINGRIASLRRAMEPPR